MEGHYRALPPPIVLSCFWLLQGPAREGRRTEVFLLGHLSLFRASADPPVNFDRLLTSGSSVGPYS